MTGFKILYPDDHQETFNDGNRLAHRCSEIWHEKVMRFMKDYNLVEVIDMDDHQLVTTE